MCECLFHYLLCLIVLPKSLVGSFISFRGWIRSKKMELFCFRGVGVLKIDTSTASLRVESTLPHHMHDATAAARLLVLGVTGECRK